MTRTLKTSWQALTVARLARVLGDRGFSRTDVREVAEYVNHTGKGSHVLMDTTGAREALISEGDTEPGMWDVEIRDLPAAMREVPASEIKPGDVIASSGFEVTSAARNADSTVTIHYRWHLGDAPQIGNFTVAHFDRQIMLDHRFELGERVVNRVSGRTGIVTGLGKTINRAGQIIPTVTIDADAPHLTGPESITYPAQACDAAPAQDTGEIELAPGYVCDTCAYAINYAEWPGWWSEGETAHREDIVRRATEDGRISMIVDLDGVDDFRDDTCEYHGYRFAGTMYPVSMFRRELAA